jgi:hypothetical protein
LTFSYTAARAQISISYDGSAGQSNVVNSLGFAINGDTVSIGTFTNFDPTLPGNASDLSALESHWVNFDSTTTRTILGVDGRFAATSPAINNSIFDGKQIYLWITEGSGNNITEYGLFTSSGNSDWIFPAHDSVIPPNPLSTSEVNQFLFGDGISSGNPLSSTPGSLQTAVVAVPEPGAITLLSVGLGALLFARRGGR